MPRTTLETHLIAERRRGLAPAVADVLLDVVAGVKAIAAVLGRAVVCGAIGLVDGDDDPERRTMDLLASELLVDACVSGAHAAAVASRELPEPRRVPGWRPGEVLLAVEPLDASRNLCIDHSVGTLFSVLPRPAGGALGTEAFLQAGSAQLAAGYALYGPCTMVVLTTGRAVNGFTLDPVGGELVLTHPRLRVPEEAHEFAVNAAGARRWERAVRRWVDECVAGRAGPRGVEYDMRWTGGVVPEVHRVLLRGGVVVFPGDRDADDGGPAALRLVYEANPLALLVERAGGLASTGRGRILEVDPHTLHERTGSILGSRREVERLVAYHAEPDAAEERPYTSPLFNVRSLLRDG